MNLAMKRRLKRWAAAVGVEVGIARPEWHEWRFLRTLPIATVLDIGANSGQFVDLIRPLLPHCPIHSFEPLPEPRAELAGRAASDPHLHVHALALGERDEEGIIHSNDFSPSSSLLTNTPAGTEAFPHTRHTQPLAVTIRRLDTWAGDRLTGPLLVKIDVQGYEDRVLAGGERTLAQAVCLVLEVSFVELYAGQCLFGEMDARVRAHGFQLAGMLGNAVRPSDGRILQADAIYLHPSHLAPS